jgi:hypothetical protein
LRDQGIAAACLLAALHPDDGPGDDDASEAELVRSYVGALLIVGGLRELTSIRKSLSAPEK